MRSSRFLLLLSGTVTLDDGTAIWGLLLLLPLQLGFSLDLGLGQGSTITLEFPLEADDVVDEDDDDDERIYCPDWPAIPVDEIGLLLLTVDVTIFEHIVEPRMEFVQNVVSLSAFGDDTSTSGILCRALSKLRFR